MKLTKLANGMYRVTMRGKSKEFVLIQEAYEYAWKLQANHHEFESDFLNEWHHAISEMKANNHPIAEFGFFGGFMFTKGMDEYRPNNYNGGYKQ